MYKKLLLIIVLMLSSLSVFSQENKLEELNNKLTNLVEKSEKLSSDLKIFVKEKLLTQINNQVFVKEVKKQNDQAVTLDKIKEIDTQWQDADDDIPIFEEKTTNKCAKEVLKIMETSSAFKEVFVMDNQGAVVGENDLTSDYWQGDEAKWKNSFNNGEGGIDIGKEKYDRSIDSVIRQISVPVADNSGKVIGAITFGIDTKKVK